MDSAFETARLSLHLVRESDRTDLVALEQDPEVMRFLNGGKLTPMEGGAGEFLMPRGGEPDVWVALEKPSGAFIGWFIFHATEPGVAELGYRLRREVWGRGLATEGCRALMAKGFDEFALERIFASTMAVNLRSRHLMERLGMRHFRTVHGNWTVPLPGSEQGDVDYEITGKTWNDRRG